MRDFIRRKGRSIAFAAALLLPLAMSASAATLQVVNGTALINRGEGFEEKAIEKTDGLVALKPGDSVAAKPNSLAEIVYDDGCHEPVEPGRIAVVGGITGKDGKRIEASTCTGAINNTTQPTNSTSGSSGGSSGSGSGGGSSGSGSAGAGGGGAGGGGAGATGFEIAGPLFGAANALTVVGLETGILGPVSP